MEAHAAYIQQLHLQVHACRSMHVNSMMSSWMTPAANDRQHAQGRGLLSLTHFKDLLASYAQVASKCAHTTHLERFRQNWPQTLSRLDTVFALSQLTGPKNIDDQLQQTTFTGIATQNHHPNRRDHTQHCICLRAFPEPHFTTCTALCTCSLSRQGRWRDPARCLWLHASARHRCCTVSQPGESWRSAMPVGKQGRGKIYLSPA